MPINDHQAILSEQLLLLHELNYSGDLDMSYQRAAIHSNEKFRDSDTNRDIRLLDTIAVALTTGKPGDVFAAAFDRRERIQLILAKNGPPDPEDIEAATELISLIESPEVTDVFGLLPFLIRRCGGNINKRIHSLHTAIQDHELREDFRVALQTYTPSADLQLEFSGAMLQEKYRDSVPSFNVVWKDFIVDLVNITAEGLPAHGPSTEDKIIKLFLLADAIEHSPFLKSLVNDRNLLHTDCKRRVEKFKRCLGKVCQYVRGIEVLIQKANRLAPISYRWVVDDFSRSGEGAFTLCDDPRDAVSRGLGQPFLSPDIAAKLDERFPSLQDHWKGSEEPTHAFTLNSVSFSISAHRISAHRYCLNPSSQSGTQWITSGSHGKPYADWALPGAAWPCAIEADGINSVDKRLLNGVQLRLEDALEWLSPGKKRISNEHVSSDSGGSEAEEAREKMRVKLSERLVRSV